MGKLSEVSSAVCPEIETFRAVLKFAYSQTLQSRRLKLITDKLRELGTEFCLQANFAMLALMFAHEQIARG